MSVTAIDAALSEQIKINVVCVAACRYTAIIRFLQEKLKNFPRTFYSVYFSVTILHKIKNSAQI